MRPKNLVFSLKERLSFLLQDYPGVNTEEVRINSVKATVDALIRTGL